MATSSDASLNEPVEIQALELNAGSLPPGFSPVYQRYVLSQQQDMSSIAKKANSAGSSVYVALVRLDEHDIVLADHESRLQTAESTLADHEQRISKAEADIADHEVRITAAEGELADHEVRITQAESDIVDLKDADDALEDRIETLEDVVTRRKSEVVYTGISLLIPTTPSNLVTLLKALTPTSGTLSPFFDTTADKMVVRNENKTLNFKLSMIGSYPGGTTNRSMQLEFSGAVPDTLVASRNAATTTDNVLLATFFSVDQGGFLATNGSTLTIQANGAAFTATTIKIIAEQ